MTRILLVEDDFAIVHSLQEYLNLEGFTSDHASGQKEAEELLKTKQYQLLLLDVSLKDGDGFAVCNIAQKIQLPVIFLSASSDEETVVRGLNIGADDFIEKPFKLVVLKAKIEALLRRVYNFNSSNSLIVYKEVIFDINKDEIKYKDNIATLTKNESKILTILLENREKIVSREDIIAALWQSDNFIDENTLSVNVNRLRSKLKDIGIADFIITKKGKGYMV